VPLGLAWFAALVLVLLLHLLPRVLPDRVWLWYLKDRLLCAGVLAVSSAVLPFDFMIRCYVLGLVVAALVAAPVQPARSNA
ncbi:hypothetical protein, partial [Klebsiella pneumoniae]|uniref:hypothetical protein n=1 Tax=Klebsiella pneumoniae TaxID=573 RepID=UPI0038530C20